MIRWLLPKRIKLPVLIVLLVFICFQSSKHTLETNFNFSNEYMTSDLLNKTSNILEPKKNYCNDVFMLVTIHTRVDDYATRKRIRTRFKLKYKSTKLKYKLLFPIGLSPQGNNVETLVREEQTQFGDLLQSDYTDSYRNLSKKQISHLKYFASNCASNTILVKLDDDVICNLQKVSEMSDTVLNTNSFFCLRWGAMPVIRKLKSKWYVPESVYPDAVYPPYCGGMAYLLRRDSAKLLIQYFNITEIFWIDDIFITGFLRMKAGVNITDIKSSYSLTTDQFKYNRMFSLLH